jgi:hypothetical protein
VSPSLFARAVYFNTCRSKRNELSYEMSGVVSKLEAEELVAEIPEFEAVVRRCVQELTAWNLA